MRIERIGMEKNGDVEIKRGKVVEEFEEDLKSEKGDGLKEGNNKKSSGF